MACRTATARHLVGEVWDPCGSGARPGESRAGTGAADCRRDIPAIQAEIAYAARFEMAATLDDVLERRTGLQFFSWKTATAAAPVAAAVMQREMGWDDAHIAARGE